MFGKYPRSVVLRKNEIIAKDKKHKKPHMEKRRHIFLTTKYRNEAPLFKFKLKLISINMLAKVGHLKFREVATTTEKALNPYELCVFVL